MNFLIYFFLTIATILVVFANQLNVNNANNFESDLVRNTINSIIQNYNQYGQYGVFSDAKLALKNGYIDFVNSLSISEKEAMNGFAIGEELLLHNQPTAAIEAIQKGIQSSRNALLDAGVIVLQCLGDAMALSHDNTRQGLGEASQVLQKFGLELVNQMEVSANAATQGISAGGGTSRQALIAARQTLQAVFIVLYESTPYSYQRATKSIIEVQNVPPQGQIINQNAEAAANDPHAWAAISEINKAAEESIKLGASAPKVNRLRQLLVSLLGDFAKIAFDVREYFDYVAKLADTDRASAENIFRKEAEKSRRRTQAGISGAFLSFSSAGLNCDGFARKQLGVAIKTMEQGNVEVTSGNRIAMDLTVLGIVLPRNVRNTVLHSAVDSGRQGKIALFNRMIEAAKIAFNVL